MSVPAIVAIIAVVIGYLWYYTRSQRATLATRRQMSALPQLGGTSAGVPLGPGAPPTGDGAVVRADGTVRASAPLTSPISGLPCVAYRVRVRLDPHDVPNTPPFEDTMCSEFFLDLPTADTVIVDGSHVRLDVRPETFDTYDGASAERYFQSRGLPIRAVHNAQIEETIVRIGARVAIMGTLMLDGPRVPAGGTLHTGGGGPQSHLYRDAGAATQRLAGNAHAPLVIQALQ